MTKPPRKTAAARRSGATRSVRPTTAGTTLRAPLDDFPIVGIGCSAGGLEALEAFLSNVPDACGMAFVVVQHLDPVHPSTLATLLQRYTAMPVEEAGDAMELAPDHVYVIPPNKYLALFEGALYLSDPTAPRGLRLAVDHFLRSLAEDRQERAVGVILSGMGSDGVLGLRAIKERSGLTLAQEPAEAGADSMPRSAIEAGLVDIVASAEQLARRILEFHGHAAHVSRNEAAPATSTSSALDRIVTLLRIHTGSDFTLYKNSTLYRRIERRTALHQLSGISGYLRYLRETPRELDLLFKELLIGVTSFFRDPEVWEILRAVTLPELLRRHPAGKTLRAWVPACSSGEEAYTLAMVFRETLDEITPERPYALQIYATDLDPDAIDKARKGHFPKNIAADVSAQRLARHFVADDQGYTVTREIRDMVIFAPQNIISDPPFTKLDIISCRNLLIYFRPELQNRLLPLFHYALNPQGVMVLGSAESVGGFTHLFTPGDHGKARIFQRLDQTLTVAELSFPPRASVQSVAADPWVRAEHTESLEQLTDQLIQQTYAPAAVLVNTDGDILYISGRTGKYLEPAAGKVNVNIHAMAREGLRNALMGVLHKALQQADPISIKGLRVGTNGGTQIINLTVQGLHKPELLRGRVLVVFHDVATPAARSKRRASTPNQSHEALAQELQQTRETLRVTHEEMQTSLEELKSTNEELQSTNEELQSTNEELTTSKEEMQSLNEELQTVNAELQSRVDDLVGERNDMTNLLNSTEIATIFLDGVLQLRRYTPHATRLFKLIPGDVGRPLTDIVSDLDYPELKADAQEVLRTLVFREQQVSTHDDHWYRVRIMPYRTQDNVINGVVMTFVDITDIKLLEAQLRERAR